MFTGDVLGKALREAMRLKGVTQAAVGDAFGVRQASVSDWVKHGRIGKKHIPRLVEFFQDVVGPEHWGLPAEWGNRDQYEALSDESLQVALAYEKLSPSERQRFRLLMMAARDGVNPTGFPVLNRDASAPADPMIGGSSGLGELDEIPPAPQKERRQ